MILLRNATSQIQPVVISEPSSRKLHTVQVVAQGALELEIVQVTGDVKSKVTKGIFKAFDQEGKKFSFPTASAPVVEAKEEPKLEEKVEEPEVETQEETPEQQPEEDQSEPEEDSTEEDSSEKFSCDECGEEFDTKRGLSSHKRSHK